jgi:archaellum component FlaC
MADGKIENEFEKLAEEIDHRAQKIKCSILEYIEGLQAIIDRLTSALESAQSDLEGKDDE